MEPAARELLGVAEDLDHAERLPGFDWVDLCVRVTSLWPAQIAGQPFMLDDRAQDASWFADMSIQPPGPQPNWTDTVFAVRFSNFGELFITCSHGPEPSD